VINNPVDRNIFDLKKANEIRLTESNVMYDEEVATNNFTPSIKVECLMIPA
jgi:hypothetical protein